MPRQKMRDKKWAKSLCRRFIGFLENNAGLSLKDAATRLEYKNDSTLGSVKAGRSFPGMEKIMLAARKVKDPDGRRLDLNWLFTGQGNPLIEPPPPRAASPKRHDIIKFVGELSDSQRSLLAALLSNSVPAGRP